MMLQALFPILFIVNRATNPTTPALGVLQATRTATKSLAPRVSKSADDLLATVCDRFKTNGLSGKSSAIEEMIEELANQRVTLDPSKCLNGPLYAVQYIDLGPKKTPPSWVKYTTKGSIVGQSYQLKDPKSINELRIVNYAEAFNGFIKLKSEGGGILADDSKKSLVKPSARSPQSYFQFLFPDSENSNDNNGGGELLQCPVNYIIPPGSALSSSVAIFGKKFFNFGIKGEGTVRILYANEKMRILEAPQTEANWEPRGIRTVQVRVDLVKENFALF